MENVARKKNIVRADEVIGLNVINTNKENLGKIFQIVIDKTSGQVNYIVLESGAILGLGGKLLALPWNSIHYDINEEAFLLNVSKEELQQAPGFDKNNWPQFSDVNWVKSISDFYAKF